LLLFAARNGYAGVTLEGCCEALPAYPYLLALLLPLLLAVCCSLLSPLFLLLLLLLRLVCHQYEIW